MTQQITVADLRKIGVSKPYAHQLIAGDRTPSLKLALQIEEAYGVAPSAWPLQSHDDASSSTAAPASEAVQ